MKPVAQPGSAMEGTLTAGVPVRAAGASRSSPPESALTTGMLKLVAKVGSAICGTVMPLDAGAVAVGVAFGRAGVRAGSDGAVTAGMLKLVANVGSAIWGMVNAGAGAGGGVDA